jgi:hypothetical protein
MRNPSTKDFAEFFRLALEAGLCRETEIENWADKMIVESSSPIPDWLINLSTDRENSNNKLLEFVPGEPDQIAAWSLFLARLGLADRTKKLNRDQIVSILFRWAVISAVPKPFSKAAYNLAQMFDGVSEGWYSEDQFIKHFEDFFAPFHSFESSLPQSTLHASQ